LGNWSNNSLFSALKLENMSVSSAISTTNQECLFAGGTGSRHGQVCLSHPG
jgi:hypothetical protein